MVNSRRIARELALKTLFQVDVGKQPLSEVLEGALEQVRSTVDNPVTQVAQEAQTALRKYATEQAADLSTQSSRQIKAAATHAVTELKRFGERVGEETRAIVSETAPLAPERAEEELGVALGDLRAGLRRIAERDSFYPDRLREIASQAEKWGRQMVAAFHKHIDTAAQIGQFTVYLVHGVTVKHDEIDARIAALSSGWALDRQAAVDRNIMRVAAYEILFEPDIPTGASINEAVEMAKKFSTAESGRFVNGVLGALAGSNEPAKQAGEG